MATQGFVVLEGATTSEDFVKCIEEVNAIIDASPLKGKAFVYADIFTYWTAFMTIERVLWEALGIETLVIFALSCLLLQSATAALIVAVMSVMIVINILFFVVVIITDIVMLVAMRMILIVVMIMVVMKK